MKIMRKTVLAESNYSKVALKNRSKAKFHKCLRTIMEIWIDQKYQLYYLS